jgi:hypothetical protein
MIASAPSWTSLVYLHVWMDWHNCLPSSINNFPLTGIDSCCPISGRLIVDASEGYVRGENVPNLLECLASEDLSLVAKRRH